MPPACARKRIEEAFGWIKTVAGLRQTKLRGLAKVGWPFTFAAAYNLIRLGPCCTCSANPNMPRRMSVQPVASQIRTSLRTGIMA